MPLIRDSYEPHGGRLLLWKLTAEEELPVRYGEAEKKLLLGIEHPLRRRQRLATCSLLQLLGPDTVDSLWYDDKGKPWIKDPEGHISISHSPEIVGLYYHPSAHVGLDIEAPHPRIAKVATRFIHPIKESWGLEGDEQMLKIWSAKEAAFKTIGGGGIHFIDDLTVSEPDKNGEGRIIYSGHLGKRHFKVRYLYLEDAMLVYTIAV